MTRPGWRIWFCSGFLLLAFAAGPTGARADKADDYDPTQVGVGNAMRDAAAKAAKLGGGAITLPGLPAPPKIEDNPSATEDEDIQALLKQQKANSQFYQDLNTRLETVPAPSVFIQKLSESLKAVVSGTPTLPALPPSAIALANHPNRVWLLYGSLIALAVVFLIRRWRLAVAQSSLARAWVQLWTTGLLLASIVVLVPWMAFGDSYVSLYRELYAAVGNRSRSAASYTEPRTRRPGADISIIR